MIPLGSPSRLVDSMGSFLNFATPVFVPSLLIFAFHSSTSLRTWFAVQNARTNTPAVLLPQPLYLSPEVHQSRFTRLETKILKFCHRNNLLAALPPLWLAFTLFAGMLLQFTGAQPWGMDEETFFRYSLLPVFLLANCRLLASITGVEKRLVFRSVIGRPFIQSYLRVDINHALSFMPYMVSAVISYRASFCDTDRFSLSMTYGALLYLLISSEITISRSFKAAFLCALINGLTLILLLASLTHSTMQTHSKVFFPLLDALLERTQLVFAQRQYGTLHLWSPSGSGTADNAKWPLFILSVLWAVFPADLISLCYRFDYHVHATKAARSYLNEEEQNGRYEQSHYDEEDDIPDNANASFLNLSSSRKSGRSSRDSPPPSASSTSTFTPEPPNLFYDEENEINCDFGACIPSSNALSDFSTPLFCSTILAWVLCNLALFCALRCSGMSSVTEFHYAEALIALAAMPTMTLSVILMATLTGNFGLMWHFSEQWSQQRSRRNIVLTSTTEKN